MEIKQMKDSNKFKKKMQKTMPSFTDSVEGLSIEDTDKQILLLSKQLKLVEMEMELDEEIEQLKNTLKEMQAPYNDAKKMLKNKVTYLALLLQEKGVNLNGHP
jgi:uncharacterized protein YlxW (UPF0749 family)